MSMQRIRSNLRQLWQGSAFSPSSHQHTTQPPLRGRASTQGRFRKGTRQDDKRIHQSSPNHLHTDYRSTGRSTGLDVARFGLLSLATLPFTTWLALFTYDYYYRVELSQRCLTQHVTSLSSTTDEEEGPNMIGREAQKEEVLTLLSDPPRQMIVVAGPNEVGKSRFIESVLWTHQKHRKKGDKQQGVVYIQSSQIINSLSTLTKLFVHAFLLEWLKLRYALVDVLPFAGSEILVMKERYSERDFTQALEVITEALERHKEQQERISKKKDHQRPVIVLDGLAEGGSWFRSPEGQQTLQHILKWCVTITKERQLAHVLFTGNEELVISLTDQNRMTRGHVHVVGLSNLDPRHAGPIVRQAWPDATLEEIMKLTDAFGGFIHDLHATGRQIQFRLSQLQKSLEKSGDGTSTIVSKRQRAKILEQAISARFRLQVERITAAFANGREEGIEVTPEPFDDEKVKLDPYLDPLKEAYSEALACNREQQAFKANGSTTMVKQQSASWSQLQLWRTLQRLVAAADINGTMSIPFGDLRDDIFNGDMTPLLELMHEDVLGFEIGDALRPDEHKLLDGAKTGVTQDAVSASTQEFSWRVKPATPALGRVFQYLVHNSHLTERFQELERMEARRETLAKNEQERRLLLQERRRLDMRKASLMRTADLGKALDMDRTKFSKEMKEVYDSIVAEEISLEKRGHEIRAERNKLLQGNPAVLVSDSTKSGTSVDVQESVPESVVKLAAEDALPPSDIADHVSIHQHLKAVLLETCEKEEDRVQQVRNSFRAAQSSDSAGMITAADIVRIIKERTGDAIDLETAESFIETWDSNNNNQLDFDEFMEMMLADASVQRERKSKRRKRRTKTSSSSE